MLRKMWAEKLVRLFLAQLTIYKYDKNTLAEKSHLKSIIYIKN